MADKYTQMAEEWLDERFAEFQYYDGDVTELAALLRRVAREQIEEDAGVAITTIPNHYIGEIIATTLRSRAKELED